MGLPVLALIKFMTHHSLSPAILVGFAFPLPLRLLLCFRIFREACFEAIYASRLFFFRLGHIAFDADESNAGDDRLERAFRLICRTIITSPGRTEEIPEISIETVHALSMLAL